MFWKWEWYPPQFGIHQEEDFQTFFEPRPGVGGATGPPPPNPTGGPKIIQEEEFPRKEWARVWYLHSCGDDAMLKEQMFLHESDGKDYKLVEHLRQLPLQIFPNSEWEPPMEEEV